MDSYCENVLPFSFRNDDKFIGKSPTINEYFPSQLFCIIANNKLLCAAYTARLARKLYEHMRRDAASIRIQKHARAHAARRSYTKLQGAAIVIQTGLRAMAARNEFRRRRQNKGATIIQVVNFEMMEITFLWWPNWLLHCLVSSYLSKSCCNT